MASENIGKCTPLIAEKKMKIAFIESATAGWLTSEFSLVPESGKILLGGLVCYDASVKQDLFDIPKEVIEKYTAESAEVTQMLAERLTKFFKCDIAVAITGLTAPGGSETPEKPVGTMFIHITIKGENHPYRENFTGPPEDIISQTIEKVGQHLCGLLS